MPSAPQADLLLAELFAIQSAGETCAVVVTSAGRERRIQFDAGTLVHPEDPSQNRALGELLVTERKLTRAHLDALLEALSAEPGARLGDLAIARGYLTRRELGLALLADLRASVIEVLTWDDPTFSVSPGERPHAARARFPTSIEPLVLSAFRKLPRVRLAALVAPLARQAPPILLEPAEAMRALFRTRIEENEALSSVIRDGGAQALGDMMKGKRGPHDGLPFVAALAAAGSLTWPGGPPSQRSNPPPPRLVVPRGARRVRLSRAAKKKAIAALAPKGDDTLRWLLPEDSGRATTEPAASASAKIVAERAFHVGKAHLDLGDTTAAKAEFWRAHQLDPGMAEYELYLGWLTLRGDEQRAAELESIATRAKRQAPELGFASYVLSHLALLRGDVERAEAEQQRAARLGVREAAPFPNSIGLDRGPTLAVEETAPSAGSAAKVRAAQGPRLPFRARRTGPPRPGPLGPHTERYGSPNARGISTTAPPAPPAPAMAPAPMVAPASMVEEAPAVTLPSILIEAPPDTLRLEAARTTTQPLARPVIPAPAPARTPAPTPAPPPAAASTTPIEPTSKDAPTLPPAARPAPPRPRWPFALLGGLFAVGGLLAVRACYAPRPDAQREGHREAPSATPTPALTAPAPSSTAAAPVDSASRAPEDAGATRATEPGASEPSAPADGGPAGADAATTAAQDAGAPRDAGSKFTGELLVEGAPAGHRIFVGKHAVGETPSVVVAPCGKRQVTIGSRGTPRTIDIPCGGRITLKPW